MTSATDAKQHAARIAVAPTALPDDQRPEPGPIAVLPVRGREENENAAITAAGGTVAPLSDKTRGIVYTSYSNVDTLIETLEQYPQIGWVQLPFAGIDAYAKRLVPHAQRGVIFTSAKGAYSQPVAEHALMMTLAIQRLVVQRARATEWGKNGGLSLYGNNVVVVGAGGIALTYIDQIAPFGCTVTVVRRSAGEVPGADRTITFAELDEVLPDADVVMLAAPNTDETRHMINAERLRAMKSTAVLVNVGRGPLVDNDALAAALDAGEIYGAGLDVTDPEPLPAEHPLWQNDRCLITPHTADTPEQVAPLFAERVRLNVAAFLRTGEFVGIADPVRGY